MKKHKHLITGLIGVAILAVFAASFLNRGNRHGDYESWINERHAIQVEKPTTDVDKFCLKCHSKLRNTDIEETRKNYCQACHAGQPVDLIGKR